MGGTVEIPVWMAWVGAMLAVIPLIERLFLPSVRWFLQKRLNRAIDRLNRRLDLKIPPFKLTRRQVLIDRLAHDPRVAEAIADHAREEGVPHDVAAALAASYARDTVPSFSAFAYFSFGARAARWLATMLYEVRLTHEDAAALKAVPEDTTVVFVMNHRSNMDYVLVTYLVSDRTALSYAVGEWAKVWPLSALIRAMGAYFIHRKSRSRLYRRVVARYVQLATEGGVTQAVFPEGQLSRDGALQPAKLGILSYIVEGFDPAGRRDVLFVPVALNYDRILEDRLLVANRDASATGHRISVMSGIAFMLRQVWNRMTGRYQPFGRAGVRIGRPVSLRAFLTDGSRPAGVAALGTMLMDRIAAQVPVLPVPLVAGVMLAAGPGGLSLRSLTETTRRVTSRAAGGATLLDEADFDMAIETAVRQMVARRLLVADGDRLSIADGQQDLLRFYANGQSGRLSAQSTSDQ
jgi:glycerol-3-phosphate O-acyltransferase